MYRVFLLAFYLLSAFICGPARAQANDPDAQLRTFAACVGRLSAIVEYEWNVLGAVSSETTQRRDAVTEIVAAIVPAERSRDVLQWRNAAKEAQRSLLNRAMSTRDAREAIWAEEQAKRYETACTSLLTL